VPRPKGLPKTGGRKKGSGAKRARISVGHSTLPGPVSDKLRALNCDPIEGMVRIAQVAEVEKDFALAGRMYSELAQYEHPKRRAIEHSLGTEAAEVDGSAKESLRARIAGIAARLGTGSSTLPVQ
jgi:hypothetical protein